MFYDRTSKEYGSIPGLTSQTSLHACLQRLSMMQISLWRQKRNRPMPILARSWNRWWLDFVTFTAFKKSRFSLKRQRKSLVIQKLCKNYTKCKFGHFCCLENNPNFFIHNIFRFHLCNKIISFFIYSLVLAKNWYKCNPFWFCLVLVTGSRVMLLICFSTYSNLNILTWVKTSNKTS